MSKTPMLRCPMLSAAALLAAAGSDARASLVDLSHTATAAVVGGARFETWDYRPVGLGIPESFVQVQGNGTEQGYNTSGRPTAFDELTTSNVTRDLTLGEVPTVSIGGVDYYQFLLDVNEAHGHGSATLSLDKLQVYTSSAGGATTSTVASLGSLRYDLDAAQDNWIVLDGNLSSGPGDMVFLVPTSVFGGDGPGSFVYLYSRFGDHNRAGGGAEGWAVRTPVPAPGAGTVVLAVAMVVARRRRH